MVEDDLCHKIEYVTIFWDNLKCKGILPIGGVALGRLWGQPAKQVFLLKVFFFFKIPDLAHRPIAAPVAGKNCCLMALQTSYQQSDSTLKLSVFCNL